MRKDRAHALGLFICPLMCAGEHVKLSEDGPEDLSFVVVCLRNDPEEYFSPCRIAFTDTFLVGVVRLPQFLGPVGEIFLGGFLMEPVFLVRSGEWHGELSLEICEPDRLPVFFLRSVHFLLLA